VRGKRDQMGATEWAGPVAAALGSGWTVRAGALDGDVDAYLVSPDGLQLWVQTGGHGRVGRVIVTAVLGELERYVPSALQMRATPRITLSPSRRPDDAAAEITGRMLPDAQAMWAAAVAGKRAADAATARQVILAERLADALGLDEDARSEDFVNEHGVRFWWGSRLYEFRLPGVSIELHSLSPERALELAELIGRWVAQAEA
jgi:hypothetical protein